MFILVSNIKKNKLKSVLAAILLGTVFNLSIVVYSTYIEQSRPYEPFKDFLSGDGEIYSSECYSSSKIIEKMRGRKEISDVCCVMSGSPILEEEYRLINPLIYDERIAKYEPALAKGRWITDANLEDDIIDIVIFAETDNVHLDDYLDVHIQDASGQPVNKIVHVCGVLADKANYITMSRIERGNQNAMLFYDTNIIRDEHDAGRTYFIVSKKDYEFTSMIENSFILVKYKHELTLSERIELKNNLSKDLSEEERLVACGITFAEIRNNTENIIESKVINILPVLIGFGLITAMAIVSLSAVNTISDLRKNAIFYVCGMKWTRIVAIQMKYVAFLSGIGIILCFTSSHVLEKLVPKNSILFVVNIDVVFLLLAIVCFMMAASSIMPLLILRKNSPSSILKSSNE